MKIACFDERPLLRTLVILIPVLLGNILAAVILYLGCVPLAMFVFWHILRMQFGLNAGTLIFSMIVLYAGLIIYTMISSGLYFIKRKYKNSLLLAFLPMAIALIVLFCLTI